MYTRIAPTPSGYLHMGNACSFLFTQKLARQYDGTILLRIDDLDNSRKKPDYLIDIFETLQLLSIPYQRGPKSIQDFEQHFSQHLRLQLYNDMLSELCNTGLVYGCICSRKILSEIGRRCNCQENRYPLDIPGITWRMYVPSHTIIQFTDDKLGKQYIHLATEMSDFVIRKRDGLPSYQVASLADDIHYGINYIVRGQDLLPSTAAQLYLAHAIGKDQFLRSRFYHHSLLNNMDGLKLSKSSGDTSFKDLLIAGFKVDELKKTIAEW